jgi:hypothetical protein
MIELEIIPYLDVFLHKNHILPLYFIKLLLGTVYCIGDSHLQNDFFVHIISYAAAVVHDKEAKKEWT